MKIKWGRVFHIFFRTGIFLKALDGFLEILSGIILAFFSQQSIVHFVHWLFTYELIANPHGVVAQHLLKIIDQLSLGTKLFATFYLLSHGIIKLGLAWAIWFNKLWAFPAAGVILFLLIIYQFVRFASTHSIALVVLACVDILIIIMLKPEYDRQTAKLKKQGR